MAEAKSAGKGSYVSLSMEDMKDSKDSEKDDEEEDEKSEKAHTEETQSVMDDYLDEFNEVFRRKVRGICTLINLIFINSYMLASEDLFCLVQVFEGLRTPRYIILIVV